LKAFDVETFVHLPAVRSHATKPAGGPRFSGRADKKLFFAAVLQQSVIGGWEVAGLRKDESTVKHQPGDEQGTTEDSLHVKTRASF
jgi:hypothetical protein